MANYQLTTIFLAKYQLTVNTIRTLKYRCRHGRLGKSDYKPLILRLKRKASTSLGPGSALVGGGGGGGEGDEEGKKWAWARKPNRGANREVVWEGEIKE